eukprot:TRINITY_DN4876_c0_g1_i1.p1 TRINITY_DN4876_c0_g1~~TRINITY_DN4876_c0_g1_i1.p1  ORF type:complete len:521 (+),score=36.26 TRINITY_DN4876_c0_g1_i1:136-1698(+)
MILYKTRGIHYFAKLFHIHGSVFPIAASVALTCSVLAAVLKYCYDLGYFNYNWGHEDRRIVLEPSVWGGFTSLVGFVVVFRTSIAYNRFWDGATSTHKMRAEWFDAVAACIAFCKCAEADTMEIFKFQQVIVRLCSVLHAVALAEIEDNTSEELLDIEAFRVEVLDIDALDEQSILAIKNSNAKVELVFQWMQQLIVENISTGVLCIPAPILSRVFHELANGMVEFHEALKVSRIPFPFPYAQTCDLLLTLHFLITPIVLSIWTNSPFWAGVFSFLAVFILWALNAIAVEIENPFGLDANDLDEISMQQEMNAHLALLLMPSTVRTPSLCSRVLAEACADDDGFTRVMSRTETERASCLHVWAKIERKSERNLTITRRSAKIPSRRGSCESSATFKIPSRRGSCESSTTFRDMNHRQSNWEPLPEAARLAEQRDDNSTDFAIVAPCSFSRREKLNSRDSSPEHYKLEAVDDDLIMDREQHQLEELTLPNIAHAQHVMPNAQPRKLFIRDSSSSSVLPSSH